MESVDLLKIEQESSSVDSGTRNDHSSVGCKLSNNSHYPSSNLNSSSAFSRKSKTNPAIISREVGLPVSLFQDSERNNDSEALKSCETRWLRLFGLVEKKCQEQIAAQQKVFCHQIHRIQNEIKHLVKLQNQNVCLCNKQISEIKLTNSFSSLESQMGLQSETFEENELFAVQLESADVENRPEAAAVHQECFPNSVSISSGYVTCSAAELNVNNHKDIQMCMKNTDEIIKRKDSGSSAEEDLITASIQNKNEFTPPAVEYCLPLKEDNIVFPSEFEPKINEGQCGKTNRKPLTSWAQKLKQNQLKKTSVEEEGMHPLPCKEEMQTFPSENTNPTAAAPPSYTFYLNQPDGSQNSLVSDTSGLTYWKLDEKEMYHSLPENFRNEFSLFPTKTPSEQLSSADEVKSSFLKDIYQKKQREGKQFTDWDFSPSQSTHPPEILTLDPTLHMKPGQQNPGLPPHYFCGTPARAPFSPDSVADPAFFMQSDTDSFSHTSTVTSPQSTGSLKYTSNTTALHTDPWNGCTFPIETNANHSSHPSSEIFNTENEDNLTLTPSSAAHSQLLPADNSLSEYHIPVTSLEDPVVFSKIRQNLREKHARHIADLRAYYDSEIQSLKQQLEASHKPPLEDLRRINQNLSDRCDQLEAVLNEANNRMRTLEDKNNALELEVTDWKERFCAVSNTTKALQERIEEMRTSSKEKDNTISRLKRRLKDLEEAFEKAYKLSDNKDARLKEENKMFHNLLGEYESLGKEHERVKDTLNITENKLLDAHTQISDLKRTVSKLEAQIKQLEHENLLRFRHFAGSHFRMSNANKLAGSDVSRRKWLIPGSEYSIFTGQPLEIQEPARDNRLEETFASCRYDTPPEKDACPEPLLTNEMSKSENDVPEAPIIKAFKELEGRKVSKNWGTRTEKEDAATPSKAATQRPAVGFDETALSASRSPEKGRDQPRHKKHNSPNGQRSSSLPPSNRKSSTPTTREIMLTPIAVTYSPKRSPKENLSPGFSHLLSRNENTMTRFDILLDDSERSPTSASQLGNPRKRLQFLSVGDPEEHHYASVGKDGYGQVPSCMESSYGGATKETTSPAWKQENSAHAREPCSSSTAADPPEADCKYVSRIKTLAETERLFDELTHEKQQIEAQLSRIPCAGGRMTLQARLNQEALEDRLERINKELGHIRMILKRFHVLRTSANI